jgi:pimeloyl-ACP methyl ester carboxylesterase
MEGDEQFFVDPVTGDRYYTISYASDEAPESDIVLVHGLLTNPRFWWWDQIAGMLPYGNVHCISLTGHYPSELSQPLRRPIDEAFIVNMVDRQLHFLGLTERPVILIGHSTGALVSLVYGVHMPERVRALGVFSTFSHGVEDAGIYGFFQFLARHCRSPGRWLYNLTLRLNGASQRFHRFLVGDVAYDRKTLFAYPGFDQWVARYFPHIRALDARQTLPWLRDLYDVDVTRRLSGIRVPVLLLYGENDPYVDCRGAERMEARLSGATVTCHVIERSGHLYMFEAPDVFRSVVHSWLESVC